MLCDAVPCSLELLIWASFMCTLGTENGIKYSFHTDREHNTIKGFDCTKNNHVTRQSPSQISVLSL